MLRQQATQLNFLELNEEIKGKNITVIEELVLNGQQDLVDSIFAQTIKEIFDNGKVKQSAIINIGQEMANKKMDSRLIAQCKKIFDMSDIVWAAKCNQPDFIRQNDQKSCASISSSNNGQGGKTVIDYLIQYGQLDLAKELLTLLPKTYLETFWHNRNEAQGPLNWAATTGNIDFTLFLLNILVEHRSSCLLNELICRGDDSPFKLFHIAAGKGSLDYLKAVIEVLKKSDTGNKWVNMLLCQTIGKRTPFAWAIQFGHTEVLEYLLRQYPIAGSQSLSSLTKNADQLTLSSSIPYDAEIFPAEHKEAVVSLSYFETIRTLIEFGADIMPGNNGKTALQIAMEQKNPEAMRFWLERGADVNVKDEQGQSLVHILLEEYLSRAYNHNTKDTALTVMSSILNLLVEFKIDVNAATRKQQNTALHCLGKAANHALSTNIDQIHAVCCAAAEILLRAGADISIKNKDGKTFLEIVEFDVKNPIKGMFMLYQCQKMFLEFLNPFTTAKKSASFSGNGIFATPVSEEKPEGKPVDVATPRLI